MSLRLPDRAVVLLGDLEVGVLVRRGESSRFEPSEMWADMPAGERPVLGRQFEEDPYAAHSARYGLPIWFEHLLPEKNGPLREAVSRSLEISSDRSLGLLVALGEDLPGAVRIKAVGEDHDLPTVSRRQREEATSEGEIEQLPLRVSLAGIQFKVSVQLGRRGISLPAKDQEANWILKFADQRFASLPQNEFITMSWAKLSGIEVPEIQLVSTEDVPGIDSYAEATGEVAYAIKRYDRSGMGRIHQEDFAQVLNLDPGLAKYADTNMDSILSIVSRLCPATDADELLQRIVFCVLCGNDDAHAKNWSLWYPDRTSARLSPAYDLVSTVEYFPQGELALRLAKKRRFEQIDRDRFKKLAKRVGIDPVRTDDLVIEAVRRQVSAWQEARELPEINDRLRQTIDDRLSRLKLVSQAS